MMTLTMIEIDKVLVVCADDNWSWIIDRAKPTATFDYNIVYSVQISVTIKSKQLIMMIDEGWEIG